MDARKLEQFEKEARPFLNGLGGKTLEAVGRDVGVSWPTTKKKNELIDHIIWIYTGKLAPIPVSNQGAPVKNSYYDPKIKQTLDDLRARYLIEPQTPKSVVAERQEWVFESPDYAEIERQNPYQNTVYRGQAAVLNGVFYLLPLHCRENGERLVVPDRLIGKYALKEGDIVSCYAGKSDSVYVATDILTINGKQPSDIRRGAFEDAVYATEPIRFFDKDRFTSNTAKCLDWLTPICKGQRACLISPPKAGKTRFLREAAAAASKLNPDLDVFVLCVGQAPEEIGGFRSLVARENLIYSTYEDDPERQVFTADFIMKRARSYAECGRNVLLLVDSFNALARAYNDTELSDGGKTLTGGLESKTLQYLKKYLGGARRLQNGGSLTVLGALSEGTGNPMDDFIAVELCAISNLEIRLCESLAVKRLYPALDIKKSRVLSKEQASLSLEGEALIAALESAESYEAFLRKNGTR